MLKHSLNRNLLEAGCDEAGRGCLAGPVFAAAVILPQNFRSGILNDSKQLTDKIRKELRPIIEEKAIAWAVGIVSAEEIDQINILRASFEAMHRAIKKLQVLPQHLLIDGNRFTPYEGIPHTCIIEGDAKYKNIAAASILAKTYRDDYMDELHNQFPDYKWITNKGYATKEHRDALEAFGMTDHHRKTFRLLPGQLEIDFSFLEKEDLENPEIAKSEMVKEEKN